MDLDDTMNETRTEAAEAASETSPVRVEPSPEDLAAIAAAEAKAAEDAAAEERVRRIEKERLARVAAQTPNAVKLMRQQWHGNTDAAIGAVLAAIEPEAYQNAREAFSAEIEEYDRTNRPRDGQQVYSGPMPAPVQPVRSPKKGRR